MLMNSLLETGMSNETRPHNQFIAEWTLIHLVKMAKWLNCVVSAYLYDVFHSMLFLYLFQSESTL